MQTLTNLRATFKRRAWDETISDSDADIYINEAYQDMPHLLYKKNQVLADEHCTTSVQTAIYDTYWWYVIIPATAAFWDISPALKKWQIRNGSNYNVYLNTGGSITIKQYTYPTALSAPSDTTIYLNAKLDDILCVHAASLYFADMKDAEQKAQKERDRDDMLSYITEVNRQQFIPIDWDSDETIVNTVL